MADAYGRLDDPEFVPRYGARCHCGEVRYEVKADPVDAKICHCRTCQALHGAPMQWAAIFHKRDIRFIQGVGALTYYNSELRVRQTSAGRRLPCKVACGVCGTWVADEGRRMWLAFPSLFGFGGSEAVPEAFRPSCHIFYAQRVIDVSDGLPKWRGHKDRSQLLAST